MSKVGKRMIKAAKEGRAIARGGKLSRVKATHESLGVLPIEVPNTPAGCRLVLRLLQAALKGSKGFDVHLRAEFRKPLSPVKRQIAKRKRK